MPRGTSRKTGRDRGGGPRLPSYNQSAMAKRPSKKLPAVTIVIEWENAIDVEDKWTRAAMAALERELADVGSRMAARPRVTYLYDKGAVPAGTIEEALEATAPRRSELVEGEVSLMKLSISTSSSGCRANASTTWESLFGR